MKTRLRFTKIGSVKFIGHLDLMRFFQKALRRAKLDVAYSKGYSPHQLMSFASPLGVGLTSDGEYIDVEFNKLPEISKEELITLMNKSMTDEIFITDFKILEDTAKTSMSLLKACDYKLSFKDGYQLPQNFQEQFTKYCSQAAIIIEKKTKKSTKEMDVLPHILKYAFDLETFYQEDKIQIIPFHEEIYDNNTWVYISLTSGSALNIKPDLIMNDFMKYAGMEVNPFSYQIHRLQMYFNSQK